MTEDELKVIQKYYSKLSEFAHKQDTLQQSHSIDEEHEEHTIKKEMEDELVKVKIIRDSFPAPVPSPIPSIHSSIYRRASVSHLRIVNTG
jgi:hypothetical protein